MTPSFAHAETSEYELLELNDLLMAAERSKILQEEICPRMHVCFIGREGFNPDPIALSQKIEAHIWVSQLMFPPLSSAI
jgi:hypothetical protein